MNKYFKAIKENICAICVDSDDNRIYHQMLRDEICSKCKTSEGEYCYLREDANCSLDRYFPLIVETIKKVDNGLIS